MDRQLTGKYFLEQYFPNVPSTTFGNEEENLNNKKDKARMLERTMKKILDRLLSTTIEFNHNKTTAMKSEEKVTIEIKPYTLKEMSGFYKVDPRTFRKWIKPFEDELGDKAGYLYSIPQVKLIFHKLSFPSAFIIHNDEEEIS